MYVHLPCACIRAVHASGQYIVERGQNWRSLRPNRCEFVTTHLFFKSTLLLPSLVWCPIITLHLPFISCNPALIFTVTIIYLHCKAAPFSLTQVKFSKAMQISHCLFMVSCYWNSCSSLAVVVGSDHSWSHGFQWMTHMIHLTDSICFTYTEGRFGKGGLVNHSHPQTATLASSSKRRRRGGADKPKDLDHTSMDHNLRNYFDLIYVLERATLPDSHQDGGDPASERKLKAISSAFPLYVHLHLPSRSAARPPPSTGCW